jgi:hypothetical protein
MNNNSYFIEYAKIKVTPAQVQLTVLNDLPTQHLVTGEEYLKNVALVFEANALIIKADRLKTTYIDNKEEDYYLLSDALAEKIEGWMELKRWGKRQKVIETNKLYFSKDTDKYSVKCNNYVIFGDIK